MIASFFSNYLTHHQIPFCEQMRSHPGVEFYFVSTMPMEAERTTGGWALDGDYPYEIKAYRSEEDGEKARKLAEISDVMIIGSAPEFYVTHRMKRHPYPLTLRYSERIYKGGRWRVLSPRGACLRLMTYFRYLHKPLYMLCASAYTAGDLALLGSYLGRCYKWGYFPETKRYEDPDTLIRAKEPGSILWTARMIDWKHPEAAVEVARRLKAEGYHFRLRMIGAGEMESDIMAMIRKERLEDCVQLLGTMPPEQVRLQMERHAIFLFTSDQKEGWGAVLNEAMNSGCAVVANDRIGSVPFLLKNGENGLTYSGGNVDALYQCVKELLDRPRYRESLGMAAYHTLTEVWSAATAAERLVRTCEKLLAGEVGFFSDGPCSKAHICIWNRRE